MSGSGKRDAKGNEKQDVLLWHARAVRLAIRSTRLSEFVSRRNTNPPFSSNSTCRLAALITDPLLLDCDGCRGLAFPLVLPLSPKGDPGGSPSAAASSVRWMMEVNRGQRFHA
ncbi:hypothetical protein KOW79_004984 [Hemibagrus wyckioides]|uniref:Uncharacterized protein n=1 Tax=Hemibagrus wyckioides TaxID=337641 RepID=A0A9D3NY19_9TELE|nr:hypothetical protein KOW79_004984 [Hemibagrus wyckioides]